MEKKGTEAFWQLELSWS